jgi:hypothetical protein
VRPGLRLLAADGLSQDAEERRVDEVTAHHRKGIFYARPVQNNTFSVNHILLLPGSN